jgi:CubicO group peptidase (beta-lactamase class C family)
LINKDIAMNDPVHVEYGFPNQERIFGKCEPPHGAEEKVSCAGPVAPIPCDPDTDHRPARRRFLRSAVVGGGVVTLTGALGSARGWAQSTARKKKKSRSPTSTNSGLMEPGTEEFETAALELMSDGDVPAAQLCVSKDGKIVFNRAYGWLDRQKGNRLPVNARFRLASLDKVITSTAIHQLIDAQAPLERTGERMSLELRPFRVFEKMGIRPPSGKRTDPRLFDVTVKHLLEHAAGLNQEVHNLAALKRELGLTRLPTADDAMRYHFCKTLDFDPGSKSSYNSAGYWVLRVLVGLAGGSFIDYLKNNIFGPAGTADLCLSRTRPAQRDRLEVRYECQQMGPSVFPADHEQVVPELEGGGDYGDHHLILATSAEAVVRYLCYWYFGEAKRLWTEDRGRLAPGLNNGGGVYFGGMTGIRTMMNQRRWKMCNFAFLTNWVRTHPGQKDHDFNKRLEAMCEKLDW